MHAGGGCGRTAGRAPAADDAAAVDAGGSAAWAVRGGHPPHPVSSRRRRVLLREPQPPHWHAVRAGRQLHHHITRSTTITAPEQRGQVRGGLCQRPHDAQRGVVGHRRRGLVLLLVLLPCSSSVWWQPGGREGVRVDVQHAHGARFTAPRPRGSVHSR